MSLNAWDYKQSHRVQKFQLRADELAQEAHPRHADLTPLQRTMMQVASFRRRENKRLGFAYHTMWDDAVRRQAERWLEARRLQRRANKIGLKYWPALAANGCNPLAFVSAEQVLRQAPAFRDDLHPNRGWDSHGHHGLSGRRVAQLWYAAGCKDNLKFRTSVGLCATFGPGHYYDLDVRKGDSVPFLRNYARGLRWFNRHGCRATTADGKPETVRLSRKAIAALGRLTPEARVAALMGVASIDTGPRWTPLRVAHLNWPEVARYQSRLAAATTETERLQIKLAYASGQRRAADLLEAPGAQLSTIERVMIGRTLNQPFYVVQALARNQALHGMFYIQSGEADSAALEGEIAVWAHSHMGLRVVRRYRPGWANGTIVHLELVGVAVEFIHPKRQRPYWEHGKTFRECVRERDFKAEVNLSAPPTTAERRAVRLARRMCHHPVVRVADVRAAGACQAGIEQWLAGFGLPDTTTQLTLGELRAVVGGAFSSGYLWEAVDTVLLTTWRRRQYERASSARHRHLPSLDTVEAGLFDRLEEHARRFDARIYELGCGCDDGIAVYYTAPARLTEAELASLDQLELLAPNGSTVVAMEAEIRCQTCSCTDYVQLGRVEVRSQVVRFELTTWRYYYLIV